MSEMLKSLIGDDDYDSYDEDDDEDDHQLSGDDVNDEEELPNNESSYIENKEEIEKNITLKVLSEKNKTRKKKFKLSSSSSTGEDRSKMNQVQIMTMTEEEIQDYQNLKLYGIEGPKLKKQEEVNEEVNFKLDVLQSSKMFFEDVDPSVVTIYTGSKAHETQFHYVTCKWYDLMLEKGI
ncbi:predicted protein [Naegleria gruberi]|uniref:Predicted protein n=1 Tax=Naegleria gruberi TaxID=5762 RepID=D2VHW4_NAEGR|nr:uncharacterized protein NAEGRDRAFT_68468 [Naegleria gruberi]EFC43664.1 predicted protein [Naegleria gruberi]|eukprot:XP_002676408.1 predicted protein [Naegleria gruberi strain NEG-M]